jgi:hypothetical protein
MTFFTKRYHPPGTPPGTLREVSSFESMPMKIHLIDYSSASGTIVREPDHHFIKWFSQGT